MTEKGAWLFKSQARGSWVEGLRKQLLRVPARVSQTLGVSAQKHPYVSRRQWGREPQALGKLSPPARAGAGRAQSFLVGTDPRLSVGEVGGGLRLHIRT